jgi:hypothetical protein
MPDSISLPHGTVQPSGLRMTCSCERARSLACTHMRVHRHMLALVGCHLTDTKRAVVAFEIALLDQLRSSQLARSASVTCARTHPTRARVPATYHPTQHRTVLGCQTVACCYARVSKADHTHIKHDRVTWRDSSWPTCSTSQQSTHPCRTCSPSRVLRAARCCTHASSVVPFDTHHTRTRAPQALADDASKVGRARAMKQQSSIVGG